MTEEKRVQRRKVLAKWLKENILRLGPTFIKIGQQFSTRVDILAQEYVDQLSELQVSSSIPGPMIYASHIVGLIQQNYLRNLLIFQEKHVYVFSTTSCLFRFFHL